MGRPKRNATSTATKAATSRSSMAKRSTTRATTSAAKPSKPGASKVAPKNAAKKSSTTATSKKVTVTKGGAKTDTTSTSPAAKTTSTAQIPTSTSSNTGPPRKAEVVFSFDTTVSMYPCLTQVRRKVKECVQRLFSEIGSGNLRIGISAHGDYCCADKVYLTKHLPMTNNVDVIVDFVENVQPTWSYTTAECYEVVLHEVQDFAWMDGWSHVLVMIGDDIPHEKDDNPKGLDWREEVAKLKELGVTIHGVQALNRKHATKFYAELARLTGGCHLPLDQFQSIVDLVMAVCYRESNQQSRLEQYELEVQAQPGRYNRSTKYLFDRMLGRTTQNTSPPPGDMHATHPGRFQVLDVDVDAPIKDFVLKQGVQFKKGRGFYEFTKPETVQKYKEIVLMDKTRGDMFEGSYARTLLDLPADKDAKIVPANYDKYIFFIQSSSHNRKLVAGTRFLYEVPDE